MTLQLHAQRRPFPKEVWQGLQSAWSEFICWVCFIGLVKGEPDFPDEPSFIGLGPVQIEWSIAW